MIKKWIKGTPALSRYCRRVFVDTYGFQNSNITLTKNLEKSAGARAYLLDINMMQATLGGAAQRLNVLVLGWSAKSARRVAQTTLWMHKYAQRCTLWRNRKLNTPATQRCCQVRLSALLDARRVVSDWRSSTAGVGCAGRSVPSFTAASSAHLCRANGTPDRLEFRGAAANFPSHGPWREQFAQTCFVFFKSCHPGC